MTGVHPHPGTSPDRCEFVQPGPDARAVTPQMRHIGPARIGQRPGHPGHLADGTEPARQVIEPAGQPHRALGQRVLHLPLRRRQLRVAQRAGSHAGDVVPDGSLRGEHRHVLHQASGHRLPEIGHAEVPDRFQHSVDRREIPVQVPHRGRVSPDPRLAVLADDQGGHALRERARHLPGSQQRALGMHVGIDETRAYHAVRRQVDHRTPPRQHGHVPDGSDHRPFDQHVRPPHRCPDAVGDQPAPEQHARVHRPSLGVRAADRDDLAGQARGGRG